MAANRQTNMELLRIVAMFFVLVLHANLGIQPWPIWQPDLVSAPIVSFLRLFFEALSIVCVNAFILVSGWFKISFSWEKILYFVFQVSFFAILLLLIPSHSQIEPILFFDELKDQYWFVFAYLILFILAPVLNQFAEHASKQLFRQVLVAFFTMQTLFSYLGNLKWFTDGMSPIAFVGLYLLARYIRIYQPRFSQFDKKVDFLIYFASSIVLGAVSFILIRWENSGGRMFNYTNPIVIISSVFFLLSFSKLEIKASRFINWIAASCFGVYLFHTHPCFFSSFFIGTIVKIHTMEGAPIIAVISCFLFLLLIFIIGVLLDKIRLFLWTLLNGTFCHIQRQ